MNKDTFYACVANEIGDQSKSYEDARRSCRVCKDTFYWIKTKNELLKCIEERIDETKDFKTEMVKLKYYMALPSDDGLRILESSICYYCYKTQCKKDKSCCIM